MIKKSAGILVYRRTHNQIEVLLTHFGGPLWKKKDQGAWSIPKGKVENEEKEFEAAIRELKEETGITIDSTKSFIDLDTHKTSNKIIHIWATEQNPSIELFTSNTFTMEWPPHSSKIETFPEKDQINWFSLEEAKSKITKNQSIFLERLSKKIHDLNIEDKINQYVKNIENDYTKTGNIDFLLISINKNGEIEYSLAGNDYRFLLEYYADYSDHLDKNQLIKFNLLNHERSRYTYQSADGIYHLSDDLPMDEILRLELIDQENNIGAIYQRKNGKFELMVKQGY